MKQIIKNYTFDKDARTVTFTDFGSIRLDHILLITNVTSNVIVYQFNNVALGGTVAGNVLTLTFNTGSMANTDQLQIIYNVSSTDPSYDVQVVRGGNSELAGLTAGGLNADLVPSTDVLAYKWVSLHVTGTYSGTLTFQSSNDGTNWFSTTMHRLDNQSNVGTSTTGTNIIYTCPVEFKFFRVRMTSYTSGTANGVLELFTSAAGVQAVGVSGGNVNQGGTWNVGSSSATGAAVPSNAFFVGVQDGSNTLVGARTATAAAGGGGAGVLGAGVLGFDGTNYQRLRVDANGNQTLGANATGGYTPGKVISAATTNATSIKASTGTLGYLTASNTNASPRYLKVYDKASAPTVGTDVPIHTFIIPGSASGAGTNIPLPPQGVACTNGIAIAVTTGVADSDTGAVGANELVVNYGYK